MKQSLASWILQGEGLLLKIYSEWEIVLCYLVRQETVHCLIEFLARDGLEQNSISLVQVL